MPTLSRLLFFATATFVCTSIFAQPAKPRVSPARSVSGVIKEAHITIAYSSPSVKGRTIWGGLVPYDSVWRAGANEATTFETDQAIQIAGQPLPAGKYGFFVIPRKAGPWTVIFNTVSKQWGAFDYNAAKDQLRVDVLPQQSTDNMEALEYKIGYGGFTLAWEKMILVVPVK